MADKTRAIHYKQENKNEMNTFADYFNAGSGVICLLTGILAENTLAFLGWIGVILSIAVSATRLYDWIKAKRKKDQ